MDRLRIGTLGAARITPMALTRPARRVDEAEVVAVAARDRARAEKFAGKHGIPRVHDSYDALLDDPDVDAVYNPLPNGLHGEWTLKALAAGKHVLCEKPFASNATEAREVAEAAARSGLVVMEAFHYRYHPLAHRMREVVDSGELGAIRHVSTALVVPLPLPRDIRYRWDLAGGALMDTGCYTVNMLRYLAGEEPEVESAEAKLLRPQVDRAMRARFRFAGGATGSIETALLSGRVLKLSAKVVGERGTMTVVNPIQPHLFHSLGVKAGGGSRRERFTKEPTYAFQLRAFTRAVLEGGPVLTPPEDAVANMAVIDDVYTAAGLKPRGT
jgi:predicted dehydrogenase